MALGDQDLRQSFEMLSLLAFPQLFALLFVHVLITITELIVHLTSSTQP